MWRCQYCHNPDTWTLTNGMPGHAGAGRPRSCASTAHGLKAMSGGFTLSGGEPLMQHRFVLKLFAAAKAMGVHTALETNGYLGDRLSDEELGTIDLVMLDLKAWDRDRHIHLIGNGQRADARVRAPAGAAAPPIWVRFVLVPGLTDDPEDIGRTAAFRGGARQRRAGRRAAVPPDGPLQVGAARPRLHARERPAADGGSR